MTWLARLKRGLRESEGPRFLEWLRRPRHRTYIARAAAEWHDPEILAVLCQLFPVDPTIVEPRPRRRSPIVSVAAALIGCFVGVAPFVVANRYMPGLLSRPRAGSWIEAWGSVYTTNVGAGRRLALKDGTRVELNGGTRIAVWYTEHIRAVLISRGEATFAVATEPHRPFYVQVAGGHFEAMDATFDVRVIAPDRTDLTVLQGTVTVFQSGPTGPEGLRSYPEPREPTPVGPLETLAIGPDVRSARALTEQDVHKRLAWQERL